MAENISYFITVLVKKDKRKAEFTQEVFIIVGDPPEVQIRYVKYKKPGAWNLSELTIFKWPTFFN